MGKYSLCVMRVSFTVLFYKRAFVKGRWHCRNIRMIHRTKWSSNTIHLLDWGCINEICLSDVDTVRFMSNNDRIDYGHGVLFVCCHIAPHPYHKFAGLFRKHWTCSMIGLTTGNNQNFKLNFYWWQLNAIYQHPRPPHHCEMRYPSPILYCALFSLTQLYNGSILSDFKRNWRIKNVSYSKINNMDVNIIAV